MQLKEVTHQLQLSLPCLSNSRRLTDHCTKCGGLSHPGHCHGNSRANGPYKWIVYIRGSKAREESKREKSGAVRKGALKQLTGHVLVNGSVDRLSLGL
jgi:hypothetical protein